MHLIYKALREIAGLFYFLFNKKEYSENWPVSCCILIQLSKYISQVKINAYLSLQHFRKMESIFAGLCNQDIFSD
jgi:hypothetical protein